MMHTTLRRALLLALILALVATPVLAQSPDATPDTPAAGGMLFLPLVNNPAGAATTAAKPVASAPRKDLNGFTDGPSRQTIDADLALVQLAGEPLATYEKTKPPQGKKVDFDSNSTKSYRAQLAAQRNEFKRWLRQNAPAARVTGEFDLALNAVSVRLNGTPLGTLRTAPMVTAAEYQGIYYPNAVSEMSMPDPDLSLIGWTPESFAMGGAGVKVAIVDSGIDVTHPCFSDTGYAATTQLGDPRYTNNKVIVAKVFNNKINRGNYTPAAIDSHGTHVAGTVGCNFQTPANVNGTPIPYAISGVAPAALLGNYNVFPGDVESARSEDILNALDAAYADGMQVANMSLGGPQGGIQDLLTNAVDNFDSAGMVIAMSNGNEGSGLGTAGSPGIAPRGIGTGASSVGHAVASKIEVGNATFTAYEGEFPTVSSNFTAPLSAVPGSGAAGLDVACAPLSVDLTGTIALISRGACSFSQKIYNAQLAGAAAVLVVNNDVGVISMAATPGFPVTVPAYSVTTDDGIALVALAGQLATIKTAAYEHNPALDNYIAGFSSNGPTQVDFRIKPDVVAPGQNVLSSVPANSCAAPPCFAFFSGTSMASPHVAGMLAVLIGLDMQDGSADLAPAALRSMIINTANRTALTRWNGTGPETSVLRMGAGLANLPAAVDAQLWLDPVSASFSAIPAGSGQSRSSVMTLNPLGSGPFTAAVVDSDNDGAAFSVLQDGNTLVITVSADKGAPAGSKQAWLVITDASGAEVAHAALHVWIK